MHNKKLYRSDTNKVFAGILGGIGEYFDIDPTILRLGYVLFTIMTGVFPAIVGYIIAMCIVPKKPYIHHMEHTEKHEPKAEEKKEESK